MGVPVLADIGAILQFRVSFTSFDAAQDKSAECRP